MRQFDIPVVAQDVDPFVVGGRTVSFVQGQRVPSAEMARLLAGRGVPLMEEAEFLAKKAAQDADQAPADVAPEAKPQPAKKPKGAQPDSEEK